MVLPYNFGDQQMMVKMGFVFKHVEFEMMMGHQVEMLCTVLEIQNWVSLYSTYDLGHGHTERH